MSIIAKYKFDGSVYTDLIPEFNAEFTDYIVTDEVDSENSNHIIRTIESDSLPTLMRFGIGDEDGSADDRSNSLLEIIDIDTSSLTSCYCMFNNCKNLTVLNVTNWDVSQVTNMRFMFNACESITDISGLDMWNVSKVNNMYRMFYACRKLTILNLNTWSPSDLLHIAYMFDGCYDLECLNICNIDASSVTSFNGIFYSCNKLTTLDIKNLNISSDSLVTNSFANLDSIKYIRSDNIAVISPQLPTRTSDDPGTIIYQGVETLSSEVITELQAKGWSVVTSPQLIAKYKYDSTIYKNTIPVFNEGYMGFVEDEEVDENGIVTRVIEHVELPTNVRFGVNDNNANDRTNSLKEVLYLDTSNLSSLWRAFSNCKNVTKINTTNWNTSKVTDMSFTFHACVKLSGLDVTGFDTSNVTNMQQTFMSTTSLEELDLSNWDTSKVSNVQAMFYYTKLQKLDISNFNLENVDTSNSSNVNYFISVPTLTDIGMIYCDKDTINKVASLLPSDTNRTIWVESDDILQYDQYDHITYKTQKVQDTVHLNSPLLMGDTIEVIDGKTYHVHRYEKIVLNGSENWYDSNDGIYRLHINSYSEYPNILFPDADVINVFSDRFPVLSRNVIWNNKITGIANIRTGTDVSNYKYGIGIIPYSPLTLDNFKIWLSENPTTVIYELATPYYELISEEPLELTLLDTTDNTINNNSILPSNMTIANKELSTIAIKPSTTYTLSFDKSNEDSEVTIDICGGEQITTVLNRVELTTPSELGSGIRFISSDGCIVSNVRLLEGSLVEEAMPEDTFEGLQSSFDENYLIGENIAPTIGSANWIAASNMNGEVMENSIILKRVNGSNNTDVYTSSDFNIKENTNYTVIINIIKNNNITSFNMNGYGGNLFTKSTFQMKEDFTGLLIYHKTTVNSFTNISSVRHLQFYSAGSYYGDASVEIGGIYILEGDHTHLSEAKLMRYIEKGTSHYEEEDYNHVGKYKVEYKVTGKNKFNMSEAQRDLGNITYTYKDNMIYINGTTTANYQNSNYTDLYLVPEKSYRLSFETDNTDKKLAYPVVSYYDGNGNIKYITTHTTTWFTWEKHYTQPKIYLQIDNKDSVFNNNWYKVQLEEGTQATEYEPHKEDIKTYYLSSPFLEGDTIEDVNGVATHIKRYGKVVLDGNESWNTNTNGAYWKNFGNGKANGVLLTNTMNKKQLNWQGNFVVEPFNNLNTVDDFKQWLQSNPTTVVYELASPIYEPISTESILLDSYTNGHLDLSNKNIPIQKTEFRNFTKELAYLQPSTDYIVRFSSDNIGIAKVYLDSSVKEINVVQGINEVIITTPSTIVNNNIIIDGIGFNVSNVQVITDVIKNGDIKDFEYFKGLQSSFEDGLVTDENDENYGKYKVECKIVGKNKLNVNSLTSTSNNFTVLGDKISINTSSQYCLMLNKKLDLIPGNQYVLQGNITPGSEVSIRNLDGISIAYLGDKVDSNNYQSCKFIATEGCYFRCSNRTLVSTDVNFSNIQIEEGTQATEYEPYKESIYTLYLNSPLLKGDKLVIHDGKLCHYHKMGKVVIDGSESWSIDSNSANYIPIEYWNNPRHKPQGAILSDKFISGSVNNIDNKIAMGNNYVIMIKSGKTISEWVSWLQANPTTVVYELAEPYYEPIEPQISQYSFSTVKEGDMEIITALPIEIDLTYRTDINGVSSIEEQIASIQESTDISNIIDEEVDE